MIFGNIKLDLIYFLFKLLFLVQSPDLGICPFFIFALTEFNLIFLERCSKLKYLNIRGVSAEVKFIEKMEERFPNVEIVFYAPVRMSVGQRIAQKNI